MSDKCLLCPRKCGVKRAENLCCTLPGVCASPLNPVVARAGLHHWEEPVISGERGSGIISGTLLDFLVFSFVIIINSYSSF